MTFELKTIEKDESYLRQRSKEINLETENVVAEIEVLEKYCQENEVMAMAAIQLGIPKRMMYLKNTNLDIINKIQSSNSTLEETNYNEAKILINPVIIKQEGRTEYWEACASCLNKTGLVERPYKVTIEYLDLTGSPQQEVLEGFPATVFSHEYDHLNGILHIDIAKEILEMPVEERKQFRQQHNYKVISKIGTYSPRKIDLTNQMDIEIICKKVLDDQQSLTEYFNDEIVDELYFKEKKLNKEDYLVEIENQTLNNKLQETISYYKDKNLKEMIANQLQALAKQTATTLPKVKMYILLGCDTTTIYSTIYQNEEVTVLLLESTRCNIDNLNMLLAHEFTHYIRRDKLKKNIFEECIGERFVTEGIACLFSKQTIPNQEISDYCIVPPTTVDWVKDHITELDVYVKKELETNQKMAEFFWMYATPELEGMPVRTGYVYGYFKVEQYLIKNQLELEKNIFLEWHLIFNQ